jgi:hypothetical protein
MSGSYTHLKQMYVLDFLYLSSMAKTPERIADGSIYSTSEIQNACNTLITNDKIATIGSNKYISTDQTEAQLHDDTFDRIRRSYDVYLDKFARSGVVSIGDDQSESNPFPLKSSIAAEPESFQANYFGRISMGAEKQHFLTKNNSLPTISDLSLRNLERLPILLIKTLWVAISDENFEYWKLTYDVFSSLHLHNNPDNMSINTSITLLFNLALSSINPIPSGHLKPASTSKADHSRDVLNNTKFMAAFVAYPTLEAFLKSKCTSDIGADGKVKHDQTVRDYSPQNDRDFYNEGDRCSSLRDLLIHFEYEVADDRLRAQLEQMREEVGDLAEHPASRVYGLIYQWRNTLSHEATTDVKFGILLNIICMLIWNDINKNILN